MSKSEAVLVWVAEYDPKSFRLKLPQSGSGSAGRTQHASRFRVPTSIAQHVLDELPDRARFAKDCITITGLLSIQASYLWDRLASSSSDVLAQLSYESADLLFWSPVDAHIPAVKDAFLCEERLTFTRCWRQDGQAGLFSVNRRIFLPVGVQCAAVSQSYCGPLTVQELCQQHNQALGDVHGVLLPFPLGSLLLRKHMKELVLFARWYPAVGSLLQTILRAWPEQSWLQKQKMAIKTSLTQGLHIPNVPLTAYSDLDRNLRAWSALILDAVGALSLNKWESPCHKSSTFLLTTKN